MTSGREDWERSSQDELGESTGGVPAGIRNVISVNILCPLEVETPFRLSTERVSEVIKSFEKNRSSAIQQPFLAALL